MAIELRERAWDRLVRGETHRGTPGSGLGLSVVRAIALHHGAQSRLEPVEPHGLRVRLWFPPPATWTNVHATESGASVAPAQSGATGDSPVFHTRTLRSTP
jgi:K+-sensing histidine kinase KdpD